MTRAHHTGSYFSRRQQRSEQPADCTHRGKEDGVNTHEHHGDWYEIRIQGRLDDRWSAWFDGLDLCRTEDGATVLRGPVTDQAALHGLLHKLRDIGLPLLSLTRTDPDDATEKPGLSPTVSTPTRHPRGD
jgi:hypothetical protein